MDKYSWNFCIGQTHCQTALYMYYENRTQGTQKKSAKIKKAKKQKSATNYI